MHREHPRWTRRRDRAAGNGVAGGEDGGRRRDGADRATPVVTAGRAPSTELGELDAAAAGPAVAGCVRRTAGIARRSRCRLPVSALRADA